MQFMKHIRALPLDRGASTPALAMTAYDAQYAASAAQDAGFNAYLTKPLRLDVLATVVNELAARRPPEAEGRLIKTGSTIGRLSPAPLGGQSV
jgi:CheY-like chemotaxis protein